MQQVLRKEGRTLKRLLIGFAALAIAGCSSTTPQPPVFSTSAAPSVPSFAYVVSISDGSKASISATASAIALGNNKWGTDSKPTVEVTGPAAQCHIMHNDVVVNKENRTSATRTTCYVP